MFPAFVLFYLLKSIYTNSVIYSTDPMLLFSSLKRGKRLPLNFKYQEFKRLFDYLYEKEYITTNKDNHLVLKKIGSDKGFYKASISYRKGDIKWKELKALLVKEFILHNIYQQDKAITYRNDLTTRLNKTYKPSSVRKIREKVGGLGESYSPYKVFSYRGISKKLGLSISEVHRLVMLLIRGGKLKVRTVKSKLEKTFCNFNSVKDLVGDGYRYVDHEGYLIKVLGTEIVSACIK